MSIADELQKLQQLHESGALSDEEFGRAKEKVLNRPSSAPADPRERSRRDQGVAEPGRKTLGVAANRYVSYLIVTGFIGLIIFVIVFVTVFLPHWNRIDGSAKKSGSFKTSMPFR